MDEEYWNWIHFSDREESMSEMRITEDELFDDVRHWVERARLAESRLATARTALVEIANISPIPITIAKAALDEIER